MRTPAKRFVCILALGLWTTSAFAIDQDECIKRLEPFDQRIASGNYPAQNLEIAKMAREQFLQSCPFLDEATLAQMLDSFDQLLPTGTEAEIEAAREARREERRAERKQQRAELEAKRAARAEARPQEVQLPPVSPALKAPPTAKTTVARFIGRDDAMAMVDVLDRDRFNGKTRLLYIARPSREQFRVPAAMNHYYVVEADLNGDIVQHHVAAIPLERTNTAALRRGHDEIILQYPVDPPQTRTRFERWSISGSKLVATSDAPAVPWSGRNWDALRNHFHLATSDGNVMFLGAIRKSRDEVWLGWLKASPDGQVLGQGERGTAAGQSGTDKVFHTPNGGIGLVLNMVASGEEGLDSDLDTPLIERVQEVELKGNIFTEERLLVVGTDGEIDWESPALTRSFIWLGMDVLGQRGSISALEQGSAMTARRGAENGANNAVVNFSAAGGRPGAIASIGDGVGALINENDAPVGAGKIDRKWFFEYRPDGTSKRVDLTAAFRHLNARFVMLNSPDQETVYLYAQGGRGSYVIGLNSAREVAAYGRVTMSPSVIPNVLVADEGGVWVAGEGRPDGSREAVWLERLKFGESR
jgi:hypothetical protein